MMAIGEKNVVSSFLLLFPPPFQELRAEIPPLSPSLRLVSQSVRCCGEVMSKKKRGGEREKEREEIVSLSLRSFDEKSKVNALVALSLSLSLLLSESLSLAPLSAGLSLPLFDLSTASSCASLIEYSRGADRFNPNAGQEAPGAG